MGGLLGKTKKRVTRAPVQQEVMTRLNKEKERLCVQRQKTELNLEIHRIQAKQKLREGNREEAKNLIKKKIYHQRQLQLSNARLDQIDQITNEIELARKALELANFGKRSKVKRRRWKSIQRKITRQKNHESRKKLGKSDQVLGVFNQNDRDKRNNILKETRKCIKQNTIIAELISGQLRKGDETAVEIELEAIMNGSYQLPDMEQEKHTYKEGLQKPHGSEDVTAISA